MTFARLLMRWMPWLLVMPWCGVAATQDRSPPSIDPWRYTENYSYLADPDQHTGAWWEAGKWIAVGERSNLTLGAEVRARYEHYRNNEFGDAALPDEGYELFRALPYADLRFGSRVRVFTQLNLTDAHRDESSVGPVDDTGTELLQGFVETSFGSPQDRQWTLRAGRQVMALGRQRLISARYGANVLRSFDGAFLSSQSPRLRVDAFFARPVRNELGSFNDHTDRYRRMWGLYATLSEPAGVPDTGVDLYYLHLSNTHARYNQGSGAETRNTLGVRYFGDRYGWSWDHEAIYQFGDFAGASIRAWWLASDVRYRFDQVRWRPRLGLKASVISGDRDPDDPDLQTLNAYFSWGKYFGEAGLIGPSNLINLHPSLTLDLGSGWSVSAAAIFYWRESLDDGVYGVAGNQLRMADESRKRYIGTQGDLVVGCEVSRQMSFEIAYSLFQPGDFIRDTGRSDTVHFLGLEALWRY